MKFEDSAAETGERDEVHPADLVARGTRRERVLKDLLAAGTRLGDHGEATMAAGEKIKNKARCELRDFSMIERLDNL
jgi:hypothetical protein